MTTFASMSNYLLFISGPTGSGKTALSLSIASRLDAEIVNADVGQFYESLSVGTAKPDWKNQPIKHHLFDILSHPKDLNVVSYRKLLLETVQSIWDRGKLPIIVGGSLFYLKSLFYPPFDQKNKNLPEVAVRNKVDLWKYLEQIDPERAKALHPQDIYRIERALEIWEKTGEKPSEYEPLFQPTFHARFIFIDLPREKLYECINSRTEKMIREDGWIQEALTLYQTSWQIFLEQKKLIGYNEIFSWIEFGRKEAEINTLIRVIQQKTRNYSKRQVTFWKKLRNLLERDCSESHYFCRIETIDNVDKETANRILQNVQNDRRLLSEHE